MKRRERKSTVPLIRRSPVGKRAGVKSTSKRGEKRVKKVFFAFRIRENIMGGERKKEDTVTYASS